MNIPNDYVLVPANLSVSLKTRGLRWWTGTELKVPALYDGTVASAAPEAGYGVTCGYVLPRTPEGYTLVPPHAQVALTHKKLRYARDGLFKMPPRMTAGTVAHAVANPRTPPLAYGHAWGYYLPVPVLPEGYEEVKYEEGRLIQDDWLVVRSDGVTCPTTFAGQRMIDVMRHGYDWVYARPATLAAQQLADAHATIERLTALLRQLT